MGGRQVRGSVPGDGWEDTAEELGWAATPLVINTGAARRSGRSGAVGRRGAPSASSPSTTWCAASAVEAEPSAGPAHRAAAAYLPSAGPPRSQVRCVPPAASAGAGGGRLRRGGPCAPAAGSAVASLLAYTSPGTRCPAPGKGSACGPCSLLVN